MIKITYNYCTAATIIFDDEFRIKKIDSLDVIREKIEWAFNEYNFKYATVIDTVTGDILMEAFREED